MGRFYGRWRKLKGFGGLLFSAGVSPEQKN
jgi:hypothetical protein